MTTTIMIIGLAFLCLCAGLVTLFLTSFYKESFIKALVFKGIASICFISFGAINCFSRELTPTGLIIFIGLCFGIVGDEIIALCQLLPKHDAVCFIGGGSSFLVGHILYIVALFLLGDMNWLSLVVCFVITAISGLIYERRKKFLVGDIKCLLLLYLGIVVLMTSVAFGLFVNRGTVGAGLFTLGGLLFTVSDNILFAYKLGEKSKFSQNVVLHIAYYLAQFSIAFSISLL